MALFRKYSLFLILIILLAGCKSKKKSLSGDEPVEIIDFIEFFTDTKLPNQFDDRKLLKKEQYKFIIIYKLIYLIF